MKDPIKGRVICITGDFGSKRSAADLKRWIESNGGQFSLGISAQVTHLICSKAAWQAQNPVVKAALKQPRTHIVSYDWLEDSLLESRRQIEGPYLWTSIRKKKAEKSTKIKEDTSKYMVAKQPVKLFLKGAALAEEDLHSDNYHIYQDPTTFSYSMIITRADASGLNIDKIALRLYETNTSRPSQYAVVAIYDKHESDNRKPDRRILVPMGAQFHVAFAAFRKFFQQTTGVEWDFRSWNNVLPVSMTAKAALREEGWRVERMAGENMQRVKEASTDFLKGDMKANPLEASTPATSAKDFCYQYKLPMPNQGQPRGTEYLTDVGRERHGENTRTTEERVGGVPVARAKANNH